MSFDTRKPGSSNSELLGFVRGLSRQQKLLVLREFKREALVAELDHLLFVFKTDDLDLRAVDMAVKEERSKAYARWKSAR